MSSPTVIRYQSVGNYFVQVVTYTDISGFSSSLQIYKSHPSGRTSLEGESIWDGETAKEFLFEVITLLEEMIKDGKDNVPAIIRAIHKNYWEI